MQIYYVMLRNEKTAITQKDLCLELDALSAINITMSMIYLASAFGMMFGSGGNALAALCFLFLNPLCHFLGSDAALLPYCRQYMIPVLILPNLLGMDGVWLSITTGEILSMIMSIYYFMKYKKIWSEK